MPTDDRDLDLDAPLAARFHAVRSWMPEVATTVAWEGVEQRRRRKLGRAVMAGCGLIVVAALASVAFASTDSKDAVRVVTPTPTNPAPPLSTSGGTPVTRPEFPNDALLQPVVPIDDRLQLSPVGSYTAGQRVEVALATDLAGDYLHEGSPTVCYAWNDGELCDPESRAHSSKEADGVVRWEMTLPGWVFTPDGRQSCEVVRCRVEAGGPGRLGTEVLTIAAGAQPDDHARVVEARAHGTVVVDIDGLQPDASWTAWAAGKTEQQKRDHGALGAGVCVFRAALYCDGLGAGATIPPDGGSHRIELMTNRHQFTFAGWRDCVVEACVVVLWRTVGVVDMGNGGLGSSTEQVAVLPYRLPANMPAMPLPRLTLDRPGPFARGEAVEVTLHDLPANVGEALSLGQCASDNLGVIEDCGYRDESIGAIRPGTRALTFTVSACGDERGCYIAITPPAKGYPALAKTERFQMTD